jgi:hypothetical protein
MSQASEPTVVTGVESTVTETRLIRISGAPPLPVWRRSPLSFVPQSVEIEIIDGEWQVPNLYGPRLLKSGATSERAFHHRLMWSRSDWPDWLDEVIRAQEEADVWHVAGNRE